MKFTIAYYLVILYATVMLNPLILVVKDAISHNFAQAYHIEVIHAKYGNNHLDKELAASGSENDSNKNQSAAKSSDQVPPHVAVKTTSINSVIALVPIVKAVFQNFNLPSVFILKSVPPPKF